MGWRRRTRGSAGERCALPASGVSGGFAVACTAPGPRLHCLPGSHRAQGKQAARDEQGVLACLKRALKIANAAQQQVGRGGRAAGVLPAAARA